MKRNKMRTRVVAAKSWKRCEICMWHVALMTVSTDQLLSRVLLLLPTLDVRSSAKDARAHALSPLLFDLGALQGRQVPLPLTRKQTFLWRRVSSAPSQDFHCKKVCDTTAVELMASQNPQGRLIKHRLSTARHTPTLLQSRPIVGEQVLALENNEGPNDLGTVNLPAMCSYCNLPKSWCPRHYRFFEIIFSLCFVF